MKHKFYLYLFYLFLVLFIFACVLPGAKNNNISTPLPENFPKETETKIVQNPENPYNLQFGKAIVDAYPIGLNMRSEPNEHGLFIITIPDKKEVSIDGIFSNGWVSLCYEDDTKKELCGYSNAKFIKQ